MLSFTDYLLLEYELTKKSLSDTFTVKHGPFDLNIKFKRDLKDFQNNVIEITDKKNKDFIIEYNFEKRQFRFFDRKGNDFVLVKQSTNEKDVQDWFSMLMNDEDKIKYSNLPFKNTLTAIKKHFAKP